jgi:catechol 2,3-dioxygenase-like lactoylglutathione lyase family enzyme
VIAHVAIEIREQDAAACVGFWTLLGFAAIAPPASLAARAAWVQRGETQVHLLFVGDPVVALEGHVAVVVEDYDATLAALREAGFDPRPRSEHWGSPRCFVRSPGGHRVEVMAFAPT